VRVEAHDGPLHGQGHENIARAADDRCARIVRIRPVRDSNLGPERRHIAYGFVNAKHRLLRPHLPTVRCQIRHHLSRNLSRLSG
jgi:hypothetical protein